MGEGLCDLVKSTKRPLCHYWAPEVLAQKFGCRPVRFFFKINFNGKKLAKEVVLIISCVFLLFRPNSVTLTAAQCYVLCFIHMLMFTDHVALRTLRSLFTLFPGFWCFRAKRRKMADKVLPQRVSLPTQFLNLTPHWAQSVWFQLAEVLSSWFAARRSETWSQSPRPTWTCWPLRGSWIRPLHGSGWRSRRPSRSPSWYSWCTLFFSITSPSVKDHHIICTSA